MTNLVFKVRKSNLWRKDIVLFLLKLLLMILIIDCLSISRFDLNCHIWCLRIQWGGDLWSTVISTPDRIRILQPPGSNDWSDLLISRICACFLLALVVIVIVVIVQFYWSQTLWLVCLRNETKQLLSTLVQILLTNALAHWNWVILNAVRVALTIHYRWHFLLRHVI